MSPSKANKDCADEALEQCTPDHDEEENEQPKSMLCEGQLGRKFALSD